MAGSKSNFLGLSGWPRRVLIGFGLLLAALFILLVLLRVLVGTSVGRNYIEARIEATQISGQRIEIDGLTGDVLSGFGVEQVRVSDADGVWLEASGVEMDWKPFRLLRGGLDADLIRVARADVSRRPKLVASNPKKQETSGFLKSIRIDEIDLQSVALSEAVTPQAVKVSARGRVIYQGQSGDVDIEVVPLDGQGDQLSAALEMKRFIPLSANVDLSGPAGGLFASLARLSPQQKVSGTLTAGGAREDWTGALNLKIDDVTALKLDARIVGEQTVFDGVAAPGLHPLLADYHEWIGERVAFDGVMRDARPQRNVSVRVEADNLNGSADIVLPRKGNVSAMVDLDAVRVSDVLPDLPIGVNGLALKGRAELGAQGPSYEGDVSVVDFSVEAGARVKMAAGPVKVALVNQNIAFEADLKTTGAQVAGPLQAYLGGRPRLKATGNYDREAKALNLTTAAITGAHMKASAVGGAKLNPLASATLSGTIDLSPPKTGEHPRVNAKWSARQDGAGAIRVSANGEADAFGTLPDPFQGWLADGANFDVSGTAYPDGRVVLPKVAVSSEGLTLAGDVTRAASGALAIDARISADGVEGGGYSVEPFNVNISASGTPSALTYTLSGRAPGAKVSGLLLADTNLNVTGGYEAGALSGAVALTARAPDGPLTLAGDAVLNGGEWSVTDFEGSLAELTASANLSGIGADTALLRGDAEVSGKLPLEGYDANVDMTLSVSDNALQAAGTLSDFALGARALDRLEFDVSGTPATAKITATADGFVPLAGVKQTAKISINGSADNVLTNQRAAIFDLSAALGAVEAVSVKPIVVRQSGRGLEADAELELMDGTAMLRVSDAAAERVSLALDGIALQEVTQLLGRAPLAGELDAVISLRDAGTELSGTIEAGINGLQQIPSQLDPVALSLSGALEGEVLNMTVSTDETDGLTFVTELGVGVRTQATPLSVSFDPEAGARFQTRINGEVSPIAALLASPELVLSGEVDLDVTGALPIKNGKLDGRVDLRNGAFEHDRFGVVLSDIAFSSRLDNREVTLNQFDAKGRDGGTLKGKGVLSLANETSSLELIANKLVVFKRKEAQATASGTLALGYSDDLIELKGRLVADRARINLDALPKGGKPTLDVTFRDAVREKEAPRRKAISRLDIEIKSPGRIMFEGAGVDAEARLDARVTGSFSDPLIDGTASVVRGRFSLLGKRFDLRTSTLTLTGEVMSSRLNIEAVRENDDLTGMIKITGTPRRPTVELTSEPSVPDDEILSRILFGRSPSQLSTLEAARLAAALAQLAGGGGLDLMGGLEDELGLDTLDLGQNEAGAFEVTTGKYLADDVYLELRSGASGVPGVAVEWEPLDNVQVDVETIPGEGQSVSVKWKKDFE